MANSLFPKQLAQTVTIHAWNGDRSKLAFSPNNHEIHIYSNSGNEWKLEHILSEHDESHVLTGIDWAPKSNKIVSCSQDRNAYVWQYQNDTNTWKPTLVILRLTRAATNVKWSPHENKFAVASGAKCVSVCYFEVENDWWVSKHIKKHKSTVLAIDWHPDNILLLTSSTDFKVRVFSAFIKGVDKKPGETKFGSKLPLGEELGDYTSTGWIHTAKWSPSGDRFAYLSHDAHIGVVDVSGGAPGTTFIIRLRDLPVIDFIWIHEDAFVAVGHDCNPILFSNNGGTWSETKKLDDGGASKKQEQTSAASEARNMFKNKVEIGQSGNVTALNTRHKNTITCIVPFKESGEGANKKVLEFTTTGLDGVIEHWKV